MTSCYVLFLPKSNYMRPLVILFFLTVILLNTLNAQLTDRQKDQFFQVMKAFPSRFETIKNASGKLYGDSYTSKICIDNASTCYIEKSNLTGNQQFVAVLLSSDKFKLDTFKAKFAEWKKKIDQLDLGGALLTDYPNTRYQINPYDMYLEGKAWRIEQVKQAIDEPYKSFTIRLELLDLDQGGFMVQVVMGED